MATDKEFLENCPRYKGITVVNICHLLDHLNVDYVDENQAIKKWTSKMGAHYYARSKEDFFIREGIDEAIELNKNMVVIEDLS